MDEEHGMETFRNVLITQLSLTDVTNISNEMMALRPGRKNISAYIENVGQGHHLHKSLHLSDRF